MHPMLNSLITYEWIQSMSGENSSIKIGSQTMQRASSFRLVHVSNHKTIKMISTINMSGSLLSTCSTMIMNAFIEAYVPDFFPQMIKAHRLKIEASVFPKLKETGFLLTIDDAMNCHFIDDKCFVAHNLR